MGKITNEIRAAIADVRAEHIALRWREFLARAYPGTCKAKAIAGAFGVPVKTAERWLAHDGPAPNAANLMRAALIFGCGALEQVLLPGAQAPAEAPTIQGLADKLDQLAQQIRQIREVT